LMAQAKMSSPSSRLRSFLGSRMRRTGAVGGAGRGEIAEVALVGAVIRKLLHDAPGVVERRRVDGVFDLLLLVRAQPVDVDGGLLVDVREGDRAEVLLNSLE